MGHLNVSTRCDSGTYQSIEDMRAAGIGSHKMVYFYFFLMIMVNKAKVSQIL